MKASSGNEYEIEELLQEVLETLRDVALEGLTATACTECLSRGVCSTLGTNPAISTLLRCSNRCLTNLTNVGSDQRL